MDFITGLPLDSQFNAIFVYIDKLTKLVSLVPCAVKGEELSAEETAQLFLDNVVQFYGIPRQVVHDRNPRFTSQFQKRFLRYLGVKYCIAQHITHKWIDRPNR